MYTVCPKCALPLAVTAADLRAGQGYVRCGRCANVFNALLRLSEESVLSAEYGDEPPPPPYIEDKASATLSRPALSEPEPTPDPEPEPEPPRRDAAAPAWSEPEEPDLLIPEDPDFVDPDTTNPKIGIAPLNLVPPASGARSPALRIVDSPPRPPLAELDVEEEASESGAAADEDFDFIDEEDDRNPGTGTFETIVLEGDTFLQTEETIPEEVLASEIANVSRRIAEAHNTAEFAHLMEEHFEEEPAPAEEPVPEVDPAPELAALREATGEFKHDPNIGWDAEDPITWFRSVRSWGDWRLTAGAVALALLLILQVVNHWRDDLAARAGWYGSMRSLASMLGESLHPNWDLNAYDVRQLGAAADSADNQTLTVRLSLTNTGERAQALPLIRLTLRDRYGKAVSRGELTPEQYLPTDERGQNMIRRDQRIDTEVRVFDPTRQASSFELDVCITAPGGALRCAGDTPALAARQL
jgi:predicted Zn finger-like uncharacterized protein